MEADVSNNDISVTTTSNVQHSKKDDQLVPSVNNSGPIDANSDDSVQSVSSNQTAVNDQQNQITMEHDSSESRGPDDNKTETNDSKTEDDNMSQQEDSDDEKSLTTHTVSSDDPNEDCNDYQVDGNNDPHEGDSSSGSYYYPQEENEEQAEEDECDEYGSYYDECADYFNQQNYYYDEYEEYFDEYGYYHDNEEEAEEYYEDDEDDDEECYDDEQEEYYVDEEEDYSDEEEDHYDDSVHNHSRVPALNDINVSNTTFHVTDTQAAENSLSHDISQLTINSNTNSSDENNT